MFWVSSCFCSPRLSAALSQAGSILVYLGSASGKAGVVLEN